MSNSHSKIMTNHSAHTNRGRDVNVFDYWGACSVEDGTIENAGNAGGVTLPAGAPGFDRSMMMSAFGGLGVTQEEEDAAVEQVTEEPHNGDGLTAAEQVLLDSIMERIEALETLEAVEALQAAADAHSTSSKYEDDDSASENEASLVESMANDLQAKLDADAADQHMFERLNARMKSGVYEYLMGGSPASDEGNFPTEFPVELINEDDFKNLNHKLFNHNAPLEGDELVNGRVVTVHVDCQTVRIHDLVLFRSEVLLEIFMYGDNEAVLSSVGINEFKILMLAMYGIKNPIFGHSAYKGIDYIKAIALCLKLRCDGPVYEAIAQCTKGHFCAYKYWKGIPRNAMTQDLHRSKIMEINECYKAFKNYVCGGVPAPFAVNSFAILLAKFCPDDVYNIYSDAIDLQLARQVGNALIRQRDVMVPFSPDEEDLFTPPRV
ncbi:hypothetical protein GGR55DRAFT_701245 [Xylaria sp. FL0064]|nr:hypothetical protein GGR55DRAFT_701245 [Xylaria sp. FL0064]